MLVPGRKLIFHKFLPGEQFKNEKVQWRRITIEAVKEAKSWIAGGDFIIFCENKKDDGLVINKKNAALLESIL